MKTSVRIFTCTLILAVFALLLFLWHGSAGNQRSMLAHYSSICAPQRFDHPIQAKRSDGSVPPPAAPDSVCKQLAAERRQQKSDSSARRNRASVDGRVLP